MHRNLRLVVVVISSQLMEMNLVDCKTTFIYFKITLSMVLIIPHKFK